LLGLVCLATGVSGRAADLEPPPEDADAREIAGRAAAVLRGERTFIAATMTVRSKGGSRSRELRFHSFDDRPGDRAFIRVLDARDDDAGIAFIKLRPNLWKYEPEDKRVLRIAPSEALEPFMGGDFTNDDLIHINSEIDDYEHRLLGVDPRPDGIANLPAYAVEYTPQEASAAVWGRIVALIEVEHGTPLRCDFYDADGKLARVMRFGDIREVRGRYFPHVWMAQPQDSKGNETRIEVHEVRFDARFDDATFAIRQLKAGE
jgi:outer membrane lipoprotein-sorting protein